MSDQLKLYDDSDDAGRLTTREQIHAEVRDWFPTAESLTQQLGTDARRLAQRYPAPNTAALLTQMLREQMAANGALPAALRDESAEPTLTIVALEQDTPAETAVPDKGQRRVVWQLPQVAAAALLLVAGWSLLRWSADKPLRPAANLNNIAERPSDGAGLASEVLPVAIPLAPQEFQTLSAPEREAVLDLLEEQALGTVSLSI